MMIDLTQLELALLLTVQPITRVSNGIPAAYAIRFYIGIFFLYYRNLSLTEIG